MEGSDQSFTFDFAHNEDQKVFDNDQKLMNLNNLPHNDDSKISIPDTKLDKQDCTSPIKRRKIDKDGFVTPATPDIPKTSCYYGLSKKKSTEQESEEDLKISASQPEETENLLLEETSTTDETEVSVEDLIKNLGQETKMINLKWSTLLGESASYELFCPSRLDKLLDQAKELESSLKQQKDLLHRRLKVISETLKLV